MREPFEPPFRPVRAIEAEDGRLIEVLMAGEVAAFLGVTRQRIYQLLAAGDLPRPLDRAVTGSETNMWSRLEIEEWSLSRRRTGRPAKDPARPTGYAVTLTVSFGTTFPLSARDMAALQESMSRLGSRDLVRPEVLWVGDRAQVRLGVAALDREEAVATACRIAQLRAALDARIAPDRAIRVTVSDVEELGESLG